MRCLVIVLSLVCAVIGSASLHAEILQPTDRIVFVGDSITGQGGNSKRGWTWLIRDALQAVDPANEQTMVPLGGSGHTVRSWGNIEKKSREKKTGTLDVKRYQVGHELDKPADVVVIMLGMNDVLSTHMADTEAGIEKWKEQYRALITALRERTTPRVMAIATPTPCTEDPKSPKNLAMDQMVVALRQLAEEEGCLLLPTRETCWEVLAAGRQVNPDFHFVHDQVHPNAKGHYAIAAGMLRGLGEPEAAELMLQQAGPTDVSVLSYDMSPLQSSLESPTSQLELTIYHQDSEPEIEWPAGWKAELIESNASESRFRIEALLDRQINRAPIVVGDNSLNMEIPAPWLLATANRGWYGWAQGKYDSEKGALPVDELFRTGEGIADLIGGGEVQPGKPLEWDRFIGHVNYGGNGDPAVIDFAQVTYFRPAEIGYGLRWIFSEHERPVAVAISRPGFAGVSYVQVWVNGESIYSGETSKAKDEDFSAMLRPGWNLLSFKSNFAQWQWQLEVGLKGLGDDSLSDLRYAVLPPSVSGR